MFFDQTPTTYHLIAEISAERIAVRPAYNFILIWSRQSDYQDLGSNIFFVI